MKMSCIEGNVLVLRSAFGASIDVVVVAPPRSMWYLLHTVVHTDNAESRWMDGWWLLWYVHSMGMVIEEPAQSGLMSLHSTDSSVGCTAKIENIGIYLSDVEEGGTRWKVDDRKQENGPFLPAILVPNLPAILVFLPAIIAPLFFPLVFEEFVCLLPNLESDAKPRTH